MKIGKLEITKAKEAMYVVFKVGLCRLIVSLKWLPIRHWGLSSSSFEADVNEDGQLVAEKASFVDIGPLFIMYTRPNG